MNKPKDKRSAQESAVDLLAAIAAQLDTETGVPSDQGTEDSRFEELLRVSPLTFSPAVEAAVERVLANGEGLSAESRRRMAAATARGIARHRPAMPLPPYLELARLERGVGHVEVAEELNMDPIDLVSAERGLLDLGEPPLDPSTIASWIRSVLASKENALEALQVSLGLAERDEPLYATGQQSRALSVEQRRRARAVVEEVTNLLSDY